MQTFEQEFGLRHAGVSTGLSSLILKPRFLVLIKT